MTDYSAYADSTDDKSTILDQLELAVREQMSAALRVEEANDALKAAQKALSDISEHRIPELMDQLGKKRVLLPKSGLSISLKEGIRAAIPEQTREQAFEWLRANGHAALIKRELKVPFGMGQDALAASAFKTLLDLGTRPEDKTFVHPQTLNSFVKEQLAEGRPVPEQITFTQIREAKIG